MSGMERQMQEMRQRFQQRAASDRAAIEAALAAGDCPRLLPLAHGLAGVAGIFGYGEISSSASALEEALDADAEDEKVSLLAQALIGALDRA